MTPEQWIERFEIRGQAETDPRRCVLAPTGGGRAVYAALYDIDAFSSLDEFVAWVTWTTQLQASLVTDGPTARHDWEAPNHLRLPHTPPAGPAEVRRAIQRLGAITPWLTTLTPRAGRVHTRDHLDAETREGWLTMFVLDDDGEDPVRWTRVDLPNPDFVEHLVSDLAIELPVQLADLGTFHSNTADAFRVWFRASEALTDALLRGYDLIGTPLDRAVVEAFRDEESVYLPRIGLLSAYQAMDPRTDPPVRTYRVGLTADTELLIDCRDAAHANTLPPR